MYNVINMMNYDFVFMYIVCLLIFIVIDWPEVELQVLKALKSIIIVRKLSRDR